MKKYIMRLLNLHYSKKEIKEIIRRDLPGYYIARKPIRKSKRTEGPCVI